MPIRDPLAGPSETAFERVAIVGLGLIGGSVALAARHRWPEVRIVGIDRPEVLARVAARNAAVETSPDLNRVRGADLIVLAAPVLEILDTLGRLAGIASAGAVVTDVGSTKRAILEAAGHLASSVTFIGGHPLAGAARSGFESARPDLFQGRAWLLTPTPGCDSRPIEYLCGFVSGLGARPRIIDGAVHDRLMAALSHLPQLAASALMRVAGELAGSDGLELAGAGLFDTTRLAASPPEVWSHICATNADHLGLALDEYIAALTSLRSMLTERRTIDEMFVQAGEWRRRLEQAFASNHGPAEPEPRRT
jgi:prephenate dehydrogenase